MNRVCYYFEQKSLRKVDTFVKDCIKLHDLVFKTKILILELLKHWHHYKQSKLSINREKRSQTKLNQLQGYIFN